MKNDLETIKKEIRGLVSELAEIPVKDLRDTARFAEDLGIDSMKALEIVAAVEKKYRVIVPEEEIPTIRSLQQMFVLIEKLLNK
ncbi:MAG: hypothetical protein A3G38_00950 [Omnitrophica WOR_2 bacterium RIFCSPLOWO2_12_FULL_51_8]|nr:MAG: hypothetical protein A3G38_00950 [Omnitrophica WOR_2 bacterium RIFCSPLOWO2_12_FULL_51_8]